MEPQGSLPCLQGLAIGPWSESHKTIPTHLVFMRSILIVFSPYVQAFSFICPIQPFLPKLSLHFSHTAQNHVLKHTQFVFFHYEGPIVTSIQNNSSFMCWSHYVFRQQVRRPVISKCMWYKFDIQKAPEWPHFVCIVS